MKASLVIIKSGLNTMKNTVIIVIVARLEKACKTT